MLRLQHDCHGAREEKCEFCCYFRIYYVGGDTDSKIYYLRRTGSIRKIQGIPMHRVMPQLFQDCMEGFRERLIIEFEAYFNGEKMHLIRLRRR